MSSSLTSAVVRQSRPPPGQRFNASIFAGSHCSTCPARDICSAVDTSDACGDPLEYGQHANALHPTDVPSTTLDELVFREARWLPIPELPSGLVIGDRLLPNRAVGVRLTRSTQPAIWARQTRQTRVAVLIGADPEIEALWGRQGSLGERLANFGVDLVVAPGYSTWWGDPAFSAIHSMARSAEFARTLSRYVPTVPTVVWQYPGDLDRWADWIAEYDAPSICMDLALRPGREQRWGIAGVMHLAARLSHLQPELPRLLAHGPSTADRISAVAEAWPGEITFLSHYPWRLAIAGRRLGSDMSCCNTNDSRDERLLEHNASMFNMAVRSIVDRVRRAGLASSEEASPISTPEICSLPIC